MGGTSEDAGAIERAERRCTRHPLHFADPCPACYTENEAAADAARFGDVDPEQMRRELAIATAKLEECRFAEAAAKEVLRAYFDKIADVVAKAAHLGGVALEAILIAHGIPVPVGAISRVAGKLAEKAVEKARGGIAGAGA